MKDHVGSRVMPTANEYRTGAENLIAYLASDLTPEGVSKTSPDEIQLYYKLPTVLAYGDQRKLALASLEQFVHRFVADDQLIVDEYAAPWSMYLAGWAAWGAGSLGRFDLAKTIMSTVDDLQNTEWGGYQYRHEDSLIQDSMRTGAAALGCVWSGDVSRAAAASKFLKHTFESQPDERFYFTSVGKEGRVLPNKDDRNVHFDLRDDQARPAMFATIIAALIWTSHLTSESKYLDLAEQHMRIVLAHTSDSSRMPLATKLGWAALMLSEQKKSEIAYSQFAHDCGSWLLENQAADGSIDFSSVPEVEPPLDKIWLVGWGCDAAMTLVALANRNA
ncbi:MAG: hypothetical protein AAGB04_30600 [Pseudomonadota bacterium]